MSLTRKWGRAGLPERLGSAQLLCLLQFLLRHLKSPSNTVPLWPEGCRSRQPFEKYRFSGRTEALDVEGNLHERLGSLHLLALLQSLLRHLSSSINKLCPFGPSSKEHVVGPTLGWILTPARRQAKHLLRFRNGPRGEISPRGKFAPKQGNSLPVETSSASRPDRGSSERAVGSLATRHWPSLATRHCPFQVRIRGIHRGTFRQYSSYAAPNFLRRVGSS
jgi:hypothetical protein